MEQILINYTKEIDYLGIMIDGKGKKQLTDEQKIAILGKLNEIAAIINYKK